MTEEFVFLIDPNSIAFHYFLGAALIGVVMLAAAGLTVRFGLRSWWAVIIAGISLPPIAIETFIWALGPPRTPNIPQVEYWLDVVGPLAVMGLLIAAVGSAIGALLRRLVVQKAM